MINNNLNVLKLKKKNLIAILMSIRRKLETLWIHHVKKNNFISLPEKLKLLCHEYLLSKDYPVCLKNRYRHNLIYPYKIYSICLKKKKKTVKLINKKLLRH